MSFQKEVYAYCGLLDEYIYADGIGKSERCYIPYKLLLHALSHETVLRRGKEYVIAHCYSSAICLR